MVRLEAAVALGDIGPAAATAIPMLELVAEDDPVKPVRAASSRTISLSPRRALRNSGTARSNSNLSSGATFSAAQIATVAIISSSVSASFRSSGSDSFAAGPSRPSA
ncbi:MAG: hypothetical protein ACKONH_07470 [Planctomycetia bacterium]